MHIKKITVTILCLHDSFIHIIRRPNPKLCIQNISELHPCITLFIKVLSLLMALQSNISMARNTALLQTSLKDLANQYANRSK